MRDLWPRGGLAAPQSQPIPFIVAGLLVVTFGGTVFNVTGLSCQQAVTPDRMLGRLNATRRFIVWGVMIPPVLSPVRSLGRMEEAVREYAPPVMATADA